MRKFAKIVCKMSQLQRFNSFEDLKTSPIVAPEAQDTAALHRAMQSFIEQLRLMPQKNKSKPRAKRPKRKHS